MRWDEARVSVERKLSASGVAPEKIQLTLSSSAAKELEGNRARSKRVGTGSLPRLCLNKGAFMQVSGGFRWHSAGLRNVLTALKDGS